MSDEETPAIAPESGRMTMPERWLAASVADARARGVEGAVPVLEGFARLMQVLRDADWNDDASGDPSRTVGERGAQTSGAPEDAAS